MVKKANNLFCDRRTIGRCNPLHRRHEIKCVMHVDLLWKNDRKVYLKIPMVQALYSGSLTVFDHVQLGKKEVFS